MKKFKSKSNTNRIDLIAFIILIICIFFIRFYDKNISKKIINITNSKIDEITTLYVKKDIMPKNIDLEQLISLYKNNKNEIVYLDINYNYAYQLMLNIVNKIQDNIFKLEKGNIDDFDNNKELLSHNGNLYISVPLLLSNDGVLLANLGPRIPVKISFYEHVIGDVKTNVVEYGINNAIINVSLEINLDYKLNIPYTEKKMTKVYNLNLGSKVINGVVPSFYGGKISKNETLNI